MTLWQLRQTVEESIPWWTPLVCVVIAFGATVFLAIFFSEKQK